MEEKAPSGSIQEMIERYNRELMKTYHSTASSTGGQSNRSGQPPATPPSDSWLDERFPAPDIQRDRQTIAAQMQAAEQPPAATTDPTFPYRDEDLEGQPPFPQETAEQPQQPTTPEQAYEGFLRVYVFTANKAEPLPGARVVVTRPESGTDALYANVTTDRDGLTPLLPLPSVDPKLTMQPDIASPYVLYDVRVTLPGFVTTIYESIPVYGGNGVTQPAAMIPLQNGDDPDVPRIFQSGGPADL